MNITIKGKEMYNVVHRSLAGSQTSSTFIIWGLVKNAESQSPTYTYKVRIHIFRGSPGNSYAHYGFRSPAMEDFEVEFDMARTEDTMGMNSQEVRLQRHLQIMKHLILEQMGATTLSNF